MKILLKLYRVWEILEEETNKSNKNDVAVALIFQSIPEALILQVVKQDTAKKVWDAIKSRHLGADRVREARLQTLMAEFDRLKMKETETIDDFVVGSLEQVLDLKVTSFEDIIGRLKAYEESVREDDDEGHEDQSKLMLTNSENQYTQPNQDYGGDYKNRGQGGRFYGRGGRGRGRSYREFDISKIMCFHCDKKGKFASSFPDRLLKLQEAYENKTDETQEADGLLMREEVYLNEKNVKPKEFEANSDCDKVWYLDNGASNHMTGRHDYFKTMDEMVTGKVRFGDDSRIDTSRERAQYYL
ncbi:uncharacterized protein LOC106362908 [Brassica napus]|uniref:uncharacterized protein LOC106362908 n=1 Tax=Brassica napus TaxID=3708 RepID=UPI0006AB20E7|nr:uncharacterized protein LOC106362908 [Brassica napus]